MPRYKVMIDDNFHYMDEDERTEYRTFDTLEEALAACRAITEKSVRHVAEPGMSADALYEKYQHFGSDPFIIVMDGKDDRAKFSAWDYAKEYSRIVAGETS
jgi:hypothetical protein